MLSRPLVTSRMTETNQTGAPAAPWGMRNHSKSPLGVQKAVRGIVSGCLVSCVNPKKRSNTEKTEPPPRVSRTSSTRGIAICGISVTLFSC